MKCNYCGSNEDKVIDSREAGNGTSVRRRRECLKCERRFTTYERFEESPVLVVKRDGRRETFDRKKVFSGVLKACEKRPISLDRIELFVDEIEQEIRKDFEKEVTAIEIGERIMKRLEKLDEVAYVRFASVYRSFQDINQFMLELKGLLKRQ